jgi:hypothetical protein
VATLVQKHLCEVESRNNRSIDLEENVAKPKRITMKRKIEEMQENQVDLFFGSWESLQGDFNFGGSYGERVRSRSFNLCVPLTL